MAVNKIPSFNNEFDPGLVLGIAKKSLVWSILFLFLAFSSAFLYIRYTPPLYQSGTIIKIGVENNANKILNIGNKFFEENSENVLAGSIELIRSNVITARALNDLPLRTTYFFKGTVLSNELYKVNPFEVFCDLKDSSILDKPIFVEFQENKTRLLLKETPISASVKIGNPIKTSFGTFKIKILDGTRIKAQTENIKHGSYYFIINSPKALLAAYSKKITVNVLNDQALTINIQVEDNNARKTADLCNAIAQEFNKYSLEKKGEGADKTLVFLETQINNVTGQLKSNASVLEKYKKENRINTGNTPVQPTVNTSELENQRIKLDLDESVLVRIQQDVNENKNLGNLYALIGENLGGGIVTELITSIEKLEEEKEQTLLQATPQSSAIKFINSKIEAKKNLLIQSLDINIKNIRTKKATLENTINKINQEISRGTGSSVEYNRMESTYNVDEKFYSLLLEKKAEYLITRAGLVTNNDILESAQTPEEPILPKRDLVYIFALIVGLAASFLLILSRYILHNEITSIEDIKPYTEAPIIGVIPKYNEVIPVSELIVNKNPRSVIAEAFRSIRTNLQFISYGEGPKIIGVTSTISGEGKTFVAINLAGVMAFSGKKVVLIDLDMRKPRIHIGFNQKNDKGMSTLLINKDTVENCIHESDVDNLDYITSGPIPPNPSELILSSRMTEVINELKKIYDIIIIDTPPAGIVTDGITIMQMADYPLYIMRAHYSKKILIENINKLIDENNVKKLSIILNSMERARTRYGYGIGEGYGYGYGYGFGYGYGYYEEETKKVPKKSFFKFW